MRFESVNYRTRVYLNGRLIGKNTGAYLPVRDPPAGGPAEALRAPTASSSASTTSASGTDFPPAGLSVAGNPTGGWWNYGGLLREVYLRKVDEIDVNTAIVRPDLPCATCDATVDYQRHAAQLLHARQARRA